MFKWLKEKLFKAEEEVEEVEEKVCDIEDVVAQEVEEVEEKACDIEDVVAQEVEEVEEKACDIEDVVAQEAEEVEEKACDIKDVVAQEVEEVEEKACDIEDVVAQEVEEVEEKACDIEDVVAQEVEEVEEKACDIEDVVAQEAEEVEEKACDIKDVVAQEVEEVEEKACDIEDVVAQEVEEVEEKACDIEDVVAQEVEEVEEKACDIEDVVAQEVEEVEEKACDIEDVVAQEAEEVEEKKPSFFEKLKQGLTKTRDNFTDQISNIIKSYQKVDEELLEELEEVLITADVGVETTMDLIDNLRDRIKEEKVTDPNLVMNLLKDEIKKLMFKVELDSKMNIEPGPAVVLVVGVNGVGKTTTIGKMASKYKNEGKKVLVAAGDTFRAAAIEQLEEWGNRANVEIISQSEGSDPAAVIFDGVQAAKARNTELLICDTAGRLHNKANLMNELNKIARVLEKEYPQAKKEVLLVLDATTGQNAIIQAKVFKEAADITGIALTKLDGTAKGGVVIALQAELGVPIKFIGVGEGIEDLQPFDAEDFIDAIFATEE